MKYKIPKITKCYRRQVIKACEELRDWYKGKKGAVDLSILSDCPLCEVKKSTPDINVDCYYCPWVWFKGKSCMHVCADPFGRRINRLPAWSKRRIKELTHWIRVLKKGL